MIKKVLNADVIACRNDLTEEEWRNLRRKGIGGSDAGAILGVNKFYSAFEVYCEKLSLVPDKEDSEAMRIGRDLESYVAERFQEKTGKKVKKCNYILKNKEFPFMTANVDRLIVGENAGLECKTTNSFNRTDFSKNDIPPQHYVQCMHYMAVTGAKKWYLAELVLGVNFYEFIIERNEEEIKSLIEIEKDFWENNVLKKIEPTPDGSDKAGDVIKSLYSEGEEDKQIDLMPYNSQLKDLFKLKTQIKDLEAQKTKIEQEIQLYMKDATIGYTNDFQTSWKNSSSNRIDTAKLKTELPDIYQSYLKTSICRKFLIKEIN